MFIVRTIKAKAGDSMKKVIDMNSFKMYAEEEREQAIITWEYDRNDKDGFTTGEEVTIVGEFILEADRKLKQLLFTNGKSFGRLWEGFLDKLPKLAVGDFIRIDTTFFGLNTYRVTRNQDRYYLDNLNGGSRYSSDGLKSTAALLREIKGDSYVTKFEILPKSDYKLDVTKR